MVMLSEAQVKGKTKVDRLEDVKSMFGGLACLCVPQPMNKAASS
jgi:hypothetical protein